MANRNLALAVLSFVIVSVFVYSFWIGARSQPQVSSAIEETASAD